MENLNIEIELVRKDYCFSDNIVEELFLDIDLKGELV